MEVDNERVKKKKEQKRKCRGSGQVKEAARAQEKRYIGKGEDTVYTNGCGQRMEGGWDPR